MIIREQIEQFFNTIYQLLIEFSEKGEGRFAMEIKSQPTGKKSSELSITAINLNYQLRSIPCNNVIEFLSKSHDSASKSNAYEYFKRSVLHILEKSGFGEVKLRFESRRDYTIVFRQITVSDKIVL